MYNIQILYRFLYSQYYFKKYLQKHLKSLKLELMMMHRIMEAIICPVPARELRYGIIG